MDKPGQTAPMSVSEPVEDYPVVAAPFGHALVEAGRRKVNVVGLTADLGKYTDILPFAEAFPERFFNVGMAEQNLVGVAAGLARTGFVPFCTTYCVFATRRAYDFIAIGCALSRTNVKIIAGLPGLTTGYGGTHQGIEDLALMRAMPNLTVIDPADATEIAQATAAIADYDGPVYMRLLRGRVPVVLDPATYRFEIGKARLLRTGHEVALVSTGMMTQRTLEAAAQLASRGVSAAVLHVSTLKPFDREAVLSLLAKVPRVVTAENHVTIGGLASAIADAATDAGLRIRLRRVGIPDCFCDCGSLPYLAKRYQMDTAGIVAAAQAVLEESPTPPPDVP
jgi:transketolase